MPITYISLINTSVAEILTQASPVVSVSVSLSDFPLFSSIFFIELNAMIRSLRDPRLDWRLFFSLRCYCRALWKREEKVLNKHLGGGCVSGFKEFPKSEFSVRSYGKDKL